MQTNNVPSLCISEAKNKILVFTDHTFSQEAVCFSLNQHS